HIQHAFDNRNHWLHAGWHLAAVRPLLHHGKRSQLLFAERHRTVSQDGQWLAWVSDWLNTLGTDSKGNQRIDVFIVKLQYASSRLEISKFRSNNLACINDF